MAMAEASPIQAPWYEASAAAAPVRPRLTFNLDADIVVIGGGLAGLTIAYEAARRGDAAFAFARDAGIGNLAAGASPSRSSCCSVFTFCQGKRMRASCRCANTRYSPLREPSDSSQQCRYEPSHPGTAQEIRATLTKCCNLNIWRGCV